MSLQSSNINRLANNTLLMSVRMIVVMLVSLYTSRIILKNLGIDNYGIYNVVGSIVIMFSSVKTIFCSSTQRYVNYEMGRNNWDALNLVFNLSIKINLIVGAIFLILVEIVGLWFLNTSINVPQDRLFAAHVVFQISVISSIVSLMVTTFDALIVAHERMDYYAGVSILDVLFKLGIAFLLPVFGGDRLIIYAILLFVETMILAFINVVFCKTHFSESKLKNVWDKHYFKEMTVFAGWNFFGNTAFALTQNGLNMVLNVFGGPVVNAARGIAFQVNTALQQVINNIAIVIKPFAIKKYAEGDYKKAFEILYLSSKIYFVVQLLIVIIFTMFTREIILLWLGQIPDYVIAFLIIILWYSLVRAVHNPIDILFYSVGDMKYYQIFEGVCLSLPVFLSYFALKWNYPFYSVFLIQLIVEAINLVAISFIAVKVCKLNIREYIKHVYMPCLIAFSIYFLFFWWAKSYEESVLIRLLMVVASSVLVVTYMYYFGCVKNERLVVNKAIKGLLKRNK